MRAVPQAGSGTKLRAPFTRVCMRMSGTDQRPGIPSPVRENKKIAQGQGPQRQVFAAGVEGEALGIIPSSPLEPLKGGAN
jgi:hypothetical protein